MQRKSFDRLISSIGLLLTAILIVAGSLLTWAHNFVQQSQQPPSSDGGGSAVATTGSAGRLARRFPELVVFGGQGGDGRDVLAAAVLTHPRSPRSAGARCGPLAQTGRARAARPRRARPGRRRSCRCRRRWSHQQRRNETARSRP